MDRAWKPGDIITVQLGEHTWDLPPIPPVREILFYDLPKEQQFWKRQQLPQIFYDYDEDTSINRDRTEYAHGKKRLMTLSIADTDTLLDLRERELKRRIEGVWFMNDGEPTYLTGDHYFALQWCKMSDVFNAFAVTQKDRSYGMYLEFQARFFYFIEMCRKAKKCLGGYVVKPKKTGISMMLAYGFLNYATMYREKNLGTMSKSGEDNQRTCRKYFMDGFNSLPPIFKPQVLTDNKGKFEFNNDKNKKKRNAATSEGFDTTIFFAPTKEDAFDGPVMHMEWFDEFPKYEDPYPQIVFDKASKTVKLGERLNGKIFITSYVNEKDGEAFMQGRKIYMESKLNTVDGKTGKTKSEMYCYCISALDSLTTDDIYFDQYGKIDREEIRTYLMDRREALKHDKVALQRFTRQFPMNEEEAWRIGGGEGSVFDNARLSAQQGKLQDRLSMGDLPYVDCNLVWTGPRLNSPIKLVPLTEQEIMMGKRANWRVYDYEIFTKGPIAQYLNSVFYNKLKDDSGNPKPPTTSPFIAATDPTSYSLKSDVSKGSKCAITAMTFPNVSANTYWGRDVSNKMNMRYLYRPENPRDYYEEVIKLIFFLGCYLYPEANHAWVIKDMKDEGLQNFILVLDEENKIVPYSRYGKNKLPASTPKTIEAYIRKGEEYMAPTNSFDIPDRIAHMDDEELVKQLIEFNKNDTKAFDLAVCFLENVMAKEAFSAYRSRLEEQDKMYDSSAIKAAIKMLT